MAEEKNFENRVKQWLRSKGCYVVKYYGCGGTRAGVPDLLVCANGKNIKAEISEEQAKILGLVEDKPKTGYEGREECNNKKHYFVNTIDLVIEDENTVLFDQNRYDVGNYYSDKTIAENNARADRLLRQLRQWQALNDKPISQSD